jgi:hypothetical protein
MTFDEIIRSFAQSETVPVEAIRAACGEPSDFTGKAIALLDAVAEGTAPPQMSEGVCVLAHVLGEIGDERAFRPLMKVLALPSNTLDELFGDAITVSMGSILISLMGDDQATLERVMLDTTVDPFARDGCFRAWSYAALTGRIGRAHAHDFLAGYLQRANLERGDFGFSSWTDAATMLRFADLTELARLRLPVSVPGKLPWEQPPTTFRDFETLLAEAESDPDSWKEKHFLRPFESTVAELSSWYGYSDEFRRKRAEAALRKERDRQEHDRDLLDDRYGAFDANRHVGRNDPCPCGSGRKFKKCCLNRTPAAGPPPVPPFKRLLQ